MVKEDIKNNKDHDKNADNDLSKSCDSTDSDSSSDIDSSSDNENNDPTYMPDKENLDKTDSSSSEEDEDDDFEEEEDEEEDEEEEDEEEEDEDDAYGDEDEEYYEYEVCEEESPKPSLPPKKRQSRSIAPTPPSLPSSQNEILNTIPPEIKNAIMSIKDSSKKDSKNTGGLGTHIRFDNNGQPFLVIMQTFSPEEDNEHQECSHCKEGAADKPTVSSVTGDKTAIKRLRDEEIAFTAKFTKEETDYWKRMSPPEKDSMLLKYRDMKSNNTSKELPLRFKLLQTDLDASSKALIIAKLDQFQKMPDHSGEYFKLRNWLNGISRLPLGIYKSLPIKDTQLGRHADSVNFLKEVKITLDKTVFGQNEVKNQLMRIMAQWLSNPESKGNCIGLQGAMGVGKTSLIKQGLCTALGLPFGFISLGGASDASFLEGHGFTYEGSTYGKIAEILMKTKCMNPVFFFDELDKVSHTYRGEEIIGILTHLTDSSQNERFNDRYFGEIDLNLSKSLIIFSYNDESRINPILKDRMITIRVDGYDTNDKVNIANDYLIPELLKEYKRTPEDIVFSKEVIEKIIERVPKEEGVRNLKRGIECIISWLNMHTYLPVVEEDSKGRPGKTLKIKLGDTTLTNAHIYTYPVTVTEEHITRYIKEDEYETMKNCIAKSMYL